MCKIFRVSTETNNKIKEKKTIFLRLTLSLSYYKNMGQCTNINCYWQQKSCNFVELETQCMIGRFIKFVLGPVEKKNHTANSTFFHGGGPEFYFWNLHILLIFLSACFIIPCCFPVFTGELWNGQRQLCYGITICTYDLHMW